ncbi:hypothetical protein K2X30_14045 [bacterium]|nr:hypothetical protein [bacterium]
MVSISGLGCTSNWNTKLPASSELGTPRGYQIARTIIHLHSPYSYDACDRAGLGKDGTPNAECLSHLRSALCSNHIDAAFLTDHPHHMAEKTFEELLLYKSGDTLLLNGGDPYANQLEACEDGHQTVLSVGYEDRLMPIGMTAHLAGTTAQRLTDYVTETSAFVTQLKTDTSAIVIVPHTESRSDTLLSTLGMDGIEVFNIHANIDPKIRGRHLRLDYFDRFSDLLPYWIDPFHEESPDLAWLSLFQLSDVYAEKWDKLLGAGSKVFGTGGSDAHENTIKSKTSDGERVDSYRRLMRWVSNHFLVSSRTYANIKSAVGAGRSWIVFEGFGTPVGMDFYADNGTTLYNPGETGTYAAGTTTLNLKLPSLHKNSPQGDRSPVIHAFLYKVNSDGTRTLVASSTGGGDIRYTVPAVGIYRAVVTITPLHLADFMNYDRQKAFAEAPWILTNPVYLQ